MLNKNKDAISVIDLISSDEEDTQSNIDYDNNMCLESPVVKFPDKILMKQNMSMNKSGCGIPKLDLTKVKGKYQSLGNNIQIAEGHAKSNRSSNEYIEKLKFQLKACKNTIRMMKRKIDKYKNAYSVQKQQIAKLKTKCELLDLQLKKSGSSTNDEQSNKKDVNNTSMVYHIN